VRYGEKLVRRNRIEMVHARSHIAATIALALKKRFHLKLIFDVRGLMAEEYVDAKHWRKGSAPYVLTKAMERRVLKASDGIVTLTERIWPLLKNWEGLRGRQPAHEVIPCCTDLDLFKFDRLARERRRAELGLKDRFILVYSGSIGGWYLTGEMTDLFAELLKRRADAHFLWLTLGPRELIDKLMLERGLSSERYTVQAASSTDVPSYLSASDAGIAFYKPGFSKLATSPVKVTEYLACGLPFIINAGIGDSDALVRDESAGALVQDFNAAEYARATETIMSLLSDAEGTRRRLRETACRLFDVRGVGLERYARLYGEVCV
jgi:glycosyltransferase involved in cell wall biosynthesis